MSDRKTYAIQSWRQWDLEIDACARDFTRRFGIAPNVLVASSVTYRRINMAADREHVGNKAGELPEDGTYVDLTGFAGDGYALLFAIEERLADQVFSLCYDDDPDGGEPLPVEDTDRKRARR